MATEIEPTRQASLDKRELVMIIELDPKNEQHQRIAWLLDHKTSNLGAGENASRNPYAEGEDGMMTDEQRADWMVNKIIPIVAVRGYLEIDPARPDRVAALSKRKSGRLLATATVIETNFLATEVEDYPPQEKTGAFVAYEELFRRYKANDRSGKPLVLLTTSGIDEIEDIKLNRELGFVPIDKAFNYDCPNEPGEDIAQILTEENFRKAQEKRLAKLEAKEVRRRNKIRPQT